MKIGVIDVGGGLRGIYAVGVFDYCMDHDIRFDLGIGVSAGKSGLLCGRPERAKPSILHGICVSQAVHEYAEFHPQAFVY